MSEIAEGTRVRTDVQTFVMASARRGAPALAATVHLPADIPEVGIVIVTGGHQIRAGSHRQFLRLARRFAEAGYACLRFDLPGLGDSEGELSLFDDNSESLRMAIDALMQRAPTVRRVVLWGLCDGATAALLYGPSDTRVAGLILANPWVRTGQVRAQALVKTYYRKRLMSAAFWGKLLRGQVGMLRSAGEWLSNWRTARSAADAHDGDLPDRMKKVLGASACPTEIIIAEQDLTGQEFLLVAEEVDRNASVRITNIAGADHTFSTKAWHEELALLSLRALASLSR